MKQKKKKNLPGFGHVFDFDHFTKGALAQSGLHSICKMTEKMISELKEHRNSISNKKKNLKNYSFKSFEFI